MAIIVKHICNLILLNTNVPYKVKAGPVFIGLQCIQSCWTWGTGPRRQLDHIECKHKVQYSGITYSPGTWGTDPCSENGLMEQSSAKGTQ